PVALWYCHASHLMLVYTCCVVANFFFDAYSHHRDFHSFPTRRSSDLAICNNGGGSPGHWNGSYGYAGGSGASMSGNGNSSSGMTGGNSVSKDRKSVV